MHGKKVADNKPSKKTGLKRLLGELSEDENEDKDLDERGREIQECLGRMKTYVFGR